MKSATLFKGLVLAVSMAIPSLSFAEVIAVSCDIDYKTVTTTYSNGSTGRSTYGSVKYAEQAYEECLRIVAEDSAKDAVKKENSKGQK